VVACVGVGIGVGIDVGIDVGVGAGVGTAAEAMNVVEERRGGSAVTATADACTVDGGGSGVGVGDAAESGVSGAARGTDAARH
jgi:hypothetical protein